MTCDCSRIECARFGKRRNGLQPFRCCQCSKTFTEPHQDTLDGMYTSVDRVERILELLVERCSVSSVERVTGIHHKTNLSLLTLVGAKCERFVERSIQNVLARGIQLDELWGFIT